MNEERKYEYWTVSRPSEFKPALLLPDGRGARRFFRTHEEMIAAGWQYLGEEEEEQHYMFIDNHGDKAAMYTVAIPVRSDTA